VSSVSEHAPRPKTIRGAHTTVWATTAAARIAASQHLSNAWKPRADLAVTANGIRNTCLHPGRIPRQGFKGAILTERTELVRAAWRYWRRSRAPISIARGVSGVGKGLPEMVPATGSVCKSRDCPPKYCLCGSSLRTSDTGSPNTHHPDPPRSARTRVHHHKLGWSKFQTMSSLQEQRHQMSVSEGFSSRRSHQRINADENASQGSMFLI